MKPKLVPYLHCKQHTVSVIVVTLESSNFLDRGSTCELGIIFLVWNAGEKATTRGRDEALRQGAHNDARFGRFSRCARGGP
jgi:hypothetical protein